jgi:hypothetical protein
MQILTIIATTLFALTLALLAASGYLATTGDQVACAAALGGATVAFFGLFVLMGCDC